MNRIRDLRVANNMTMKEAANNLKMPYTTYVNYEKGLREPNSEVLIKIAKYYNVSVDYLIGSGYGGGVGSGAGFGDGSGYGGPVLEGETAYDRTVELCSLCTVNNMDFHAVCKSAGLNSQAVEAWKNGAQPDRAVLKKIAEILLVPMDFLLGEDNKKAPTDPGDCSVSDDDIKSAIFRGQKNVTDAMYEEVLNFAKYIAWREDSKKRKTIQKPLHIVKIAGRDGSFEELALTDDEYKDYVAEAGNHRKAPDDL